MLYFTMVVFCAPFWEEVCSDPRVQASGGFIHLSACHGDGRELGLEHLFRPCVAHLELRNVPHDCTVQIFQQAL